MAASKYSAVIVAAALTALVSVPRTFAQAQGTATKPTLTAKLIDPDKKAAGRAATVEVTTSGVELVDPAMSNEKPVVGQGHVHYQLDKGPIVATPSAKLSWHELMPGAHTILIMLAGNDHKPLGPQQTLTVTIPKATTSASAPAESMPASKKAGY